MAENFSNEYESTLSAGIDADDTSLSVASATGAPTANFRIRIDDEYLLVTNVAGTTFTVTRGIEGSTAVSHSSAAVVTHVLTAGGLTTAIRKDAWVITKSTSQTLTNGGVDDITFDVAEVDSGESVIDLANDRLVIPTTGNYAMHGIWKWEGTVPTGPSTSFGDILVNGSSVMVLRDAAATANTFGERTAFGIFAFTANDLITMQCRPGAVTGVTCRGSSSINTRSKINLIRL